jgi:hypothetical protein
MLRNGVTQRCHLDSLAKWTVWFHGCPSLEMMSMPKFHQKECFAEKAENRIVLNKFPMVLGWTSTDWIILVWTPSSFLQILSWKCFDQSINDHWKNLFRLQLECKFPIQRSAHYTTNTTLKCCLGNSSRRCPFNSTWQGYSKRQACRLLGSNKSSSPRR